MSNGNAYGNMTDREISILTAERINNLLESTSGLHRRTRALEVWMWGMRGAIAVLIIMSGWGVSVFYRYGDQVIDILNKIVAKV